MKFFAFILLLLSFNLSMLGQSIVKCELNKINMLDSSFAEYNLRVEFDEKLDKKERWFLILEELEKKYFLFPWDIVYKKDYTGKKYLIFEYRIKLNCTIDLK